MKLNPKQQKANFLLATGKSKRRKAEAVSVTLQTISEWLHNPHFQAALNALQMEQLKAARTELQALARKAARTLSDVMHNADSFEARRPGSLGRAGDDRIGRRLHKIRLGHRPRNPGRYRKTNQAQSQKSITNGLVDKPMT